MFFLLYILLSESELYRDRVSELQEGLLGKELRRKPDIPCNKVPDFIDMDVYEIEQQQDGINEKPTMLATLREKIPISLKKKPLMKAFGSKDRSEPEDTERRLEENQYSTI